jgi:hypothetical protein
MGALVAPGRTWQAEVMRWSQVLGVAGSAVAGLAAGCDGGYCPEFSWFHVPGAWSEEPDRIEIPVDAAPWLLRPCTHEVAPEGCALVVDGVVIPVVASIEGACDFSLDEQIEFRVPEHVIQTLRPSQPLPPGATVTLACDDPDNRYQHAYVGYGDDDEPLAAPRTLQIRTSSDPAAPPGTLDTLKLQYTRDDPNLSCTEGDFIEARVDFTAPFLREGGYIMVTYPSGQVLQFSEPELRGAAILPPSRGLLRFTPVAIDGERGETVEIDASDIPGEVVYIPGCTQSRSPGAPGLLVPVVWLALARRRREASS